MKLNKLMLLLPSALILMSSLGCAIDGDCNTITFEDLGYQTKTFEVGDTVSIDFDSVYEDPNMEIRLHFYSQFHRPNINLFINNVPLVVDRDLPTMDAWEKFDIPTGLIEGGTNNLSIKFTPFVEEDQDLESTILFEDSTIYICPP